MLVLTRKVGERIQIGDHVTIVVTRVGQTSVKLGIETPAGMSVMRKELTSDSRRPSAGRELAST